MLNKKGLTLVELLATVVILAIIALITYPIINGVLNRQEKNAFRISVQGIYKAVEIHQGDTGFLVNLEYSYNNKELTLVKNNGNTVNEKVELSGQIIDGTGSVIVDQNNNIIVSISNGEWCGYNTGEDSTIIIESGECQDRNNPTITATQQTITIDKGASNEITSYFNISANGTSGIKSTVCTSDKDGSVTNTSTLSENTHIITCTVTKNNDKSANTSITITVEDKEVQEQEKDATDIVEDLGLTTVTTGDGLYLDSDGVYRYKGLNPNNYIMLGTEEYRIMAIENQGIKVVKSSRIPSLVYDSGHDYTWNGSDLQLYLYNNYYSNLSNVEQYILEDVIWNVGAIAATSTVLDAVKADEIGLTWSGKIGVMTLSEYIMAQLPSGDAYTSCSANVMSNSDCGTNNWLNFELEDSSRPTWLINGFKDYTFATWGVYALGSVNYLEVTRGYYCAPIVYLSPSIKLTGSGTQGSGVFQIVES